ncbi:MAG: hypothetical protein M0P91_05040 [Sulfuricurvum sp.]|jgi:hypothetical protein|uniref:hypothetical protein n=1 Tax=Sulfuricurvum sp. TaxID=2025608 RepID=UPI0025DA63C0|nr:hypothetical protein [Sulfuricurvum sp.]MCK9372541.1 hypothetical protein [Sulfuricurvum sp.]
MKNTLQNKKEFNNMKYLLGLLLSASALFGFGGCDTCNKVPLEVPVDFSKKGTVYETDFQAPWNIWGSLVSFELTIHTPSAFIASDVDDKIKDYIRNGHPQNTTPYFKVKITLTPLRWASDDVTVILNSEKWSHRQEKHYTKGQIIEEIISVPLYGDGYGKTLILSDLQRLRNYHVRVESMEDVELPKGVTTHFMINRFSTKH